jgi:hypothetical protein
MANEEVIIEERDPAADLTSGLVLTTTGLMLVALIVVFKALANYFALGPLA